jgi:hypothetical protein
MHYTRKTSLSQMMLVTGALLTAATMASGQVRKPHRVVPAVSESKPGELILICKPGTPQADVARVTNSVNAAQVVPLLQNDGYKVVLDANHHDAATTAAAIAQLILDPVVQTATPNYIYHFDQSVATPNDPRYKTGEQYGHKLINMPQAWTLQKGNVNTTIAVMDSGFKPDHEDAPIFSPKSYNAVDGSSNYIFDPPADGENDHGVATSGVIGAHTNNNLGIAGVMWNRVPILAIKLRQASDPSGVLEGAAILNGYAFVLAHVTDMNITALNLSFGRTVATGTPVDPTDPEYIAVQKLVDAGVNVIASAGNSGPGAQGIPADFPFVVSVGATGPDPSKLTSYSSTGKVDIIAPGGTSGETGIPTNGILLLSGNGGYVFEDGTSFACPYTTGVTGLLRSVPGVDRAKAQNALLLKANHVITGQSQVPAPGIGYGYLDAYASLSSVSNVIEIVEPNGIDPTTGQSTASDQQTPPPIETLRPRVRVHMTNVAVVNGVPQFNVTLNAGTSSLPLIVNGVVSASAVDSKGISLISDLNIVDSSVSGFSQFDVSFRYRATDSPVSQQQQLVVSSTPADPTLTSVASSLNYNITPHSFQSGISMVSFPIAEVNNDSPDPAKPVRDIRDILGLTDPAQHVVLYRWVNASVVDATGKPNVQGQYAINGSGTADSLPQLATLHPSDIVTTPVPAFNPLDNPGVAGASVSNATPVGMGYFINLPAGAAVRTYGRTFSQQTIRVPVHEGWNMIGNPYSFPIAFSNLTIETSNGTRYSTPDAATAKLILPFIYRFIGTDYDFQTLPNGILFPWDGNWIYVIPADPNNVNPKVDLLTVVISPTQAGSTQTTGRGAQGMFAAHNPTRATSLTSLVATKPIVKGAGSWVMRLTASANSMVDGHNFIGMSSDAEGNVGSRAPKPPRIGSQVSLGIQRSGTNALYAQDLRPMGSAASWDVMASTDQPNADVIVAWPEARTLPRNYHLTLTDKVTGQTLDMRSRLSYRFNSGPKAEGRVLTVTATPGQVRERAVFNSVVVTPRGGRGTGSALYQIDYNISGTAQVDVDILGTGGRILAQVDTGRAAGVGDNQVTWNGRDNQNRVLATGAYIVRLRAVSAEGKVSQYHYPLTITR